MKPDLINTIVELQDFSSLVDLKKSDNKKEFYIEYYTRKYVKSIVKLYVNEVGMSQPIVATNKHRFGVTMETLGFQKGFEWQGNYGRLAFEGNVIVLAATAVSIALGFALFAFLLARNGNNNNNK